MLSIENKGTNNRLCCWTFNILITRQYLHWNSSNICHVLPTVSLAQLSKFYYIVQGSYTWEAMSPSSFLPPISRHLFPCPEAVMTCNIWWCWPCVISVCHHRFCMLYISGSNYHLGFSFPLKHHSRGPGVR